MRKLSLLFVVMLGIVLVAGACSSDTNGSTTPSGSGTGAGGSSSITITAAGFAFSTDNITVSVGEEVTLTFVNDDSTAHDFSSESLGIGTELINGGDSATITFTPSEAGEFTFICSVTGHAEAGMTGTITVTG